MKNIKLFTLLQTFPSNELSHFGKYVNSPFFNENQELVLLFDTIKNELTPATKTGNTIGKLEIWKKMFPSKSYNDTRFRRLCSDLLRLATDFMSHQKYKSNPSTSQVFLLHALADTRLEKHFNGVVRQMNADLGKTGYKDADYHFLSHALQRRQREHLEHNANKTASFDFLEKADYHLDCYYFSKKLEHYCDNLGYQNMVSGEAAIHMLPGLMDYLPSSIYIHEPAVKAWYLVAQMILKRDEEHIFQQLKSLLENDGHCFQKKELQTLFIHLMNYCIDTKINNGRSEYYLELFSLYKTGLDQKIIFENGELNPHHYKNIITISLHVKEFNWVENFIQNYSQHLPKSDQENAVNYNLANLYFHKKEFEKVIEQLREVEYQTIVYAIGSKLLLTRTYFELDEYLALDSLTDSFRIYLRRNRLISKEMKQQCMNTLRFTKKLSSIAPYDKTTIEKVKKQIENCKAVAAKKWLLEKVGEL